MERMQQYAELPPEAPLVASSDSLNNGASSSIGASPKKGDYHRLTNGEEEKEERRVVNLESGGE